MDKKVNRSARVWTKRRNCIDGSPPKILIVDDKGDAAEAMAAFLDSEEMQTRTAFGGLEAVTLAQVWAPDLVVMDISMPECNGFEAARSIRTDPRTQSIAIIAFTAFDEDEVRRHLADHEFDGYAQKGQPVSEVVDLIWALLERGEPQPND
jgi:two-component system OmpR family response regulator